ncbi:MAG TPA: hypothetical protein VD932_02460 [Aquabacterium sp.]|nr:hypothetical protein [Aquabacterium sp.]
MTPDPFCQHGHVTTEVSCGYLADTRKYLAEIRITCVMCGKPFQFVGPFTTEQDGFELHAVLEPERNKLKLMDQP